MRILLGFTILLAIGFSACSGYNRALKSSDFDYRVKFADRMYKEKKYEKAINLYSSVIFVYKQTEKYEYLLYKLAMSHFYYKDYYSAQSYFQEFIFNYPYSEKIEEVSYNNALCYYKQVDKVLLDQTTTEMTISEMLTFVRLFSSSEYVPEALRIIHQCRKQLEEKDSICSELYFKLGHYNSAAIYFSNMLMAYPDSESLPIYKLKEITSYYKYAQLSIKERQKERFEKVIYECEDFLNRFPESKFSVKVNQYKNISNNKIQNL